MNTLGERIKQIRKDYKETQAQLEDAIGSCRTSIHHYETGKTLPDAYILKQIALHYNVSADFMLGLTDERKSIN